MPNNLVDAALDPPPQQPQAAVSGAQGAAAAPGSPTPAAQKQIQYDKVREIVRKQSRIVDGLDDLLEPGGDIKKKEVTSFAARLVADRILSAQEMAGYLIDLPDDPARIRTWVERHAKNTNEQLDQVMSMVQQMSQQNTAQPGMFAGQGPDPMAALAAGAANAQPA